MKTRLVLAASAMALTLPAFADNVTVQNGMKCTTTMEGEHKKKVICMQDGAGHPDGAGPEVVVVPGEGGPNEDVNVRVTTDGKKEQRVYIVRRHVMDDADTNKDGKISREEFMARAAKHFDEMDKNHNGTLEGEEMHPPMPPLPPGVPPIPPVPPVPPVPPAPPAPGQN